MIVAIILVSCVVKFECYFSGLLQLLLRRKHCGLGPAQSGFSEAVPRPHRRCVMYRYFSRRHQAMDRRFGQHCAVVGPPEGFAIAAA